jgi:hypothetical protein
MSKENEMGGTSWYSRNNNNSLRTPLFVQQQQLPSTQGSDRFIHRSDTVLTHQPSHKSLSQSRGSCSSSLTQSNIHSLSNLNPSSAPSSAAQASVPHTTKRSSQQHSQSPRSPLPSIATSKEQDDDNNDHDPDQLPISNVGRGGSGAPIRSSSLMRAFVVDLDLNLLLLLLDHLIMSTSMEPPTKSPLWDLLLQSAVVLNLDWKSTKWSWSRGGAGYRIRIWNPRSCGGYYKEQNSWGRGDDGDGEVDADVDAELLEAVDAAEANSSSSHGGERMRMKSESWCRKVVGLLARRSSGCWSPPFLRPSDRGSEWLEGLFTCVYLHFLFSTLVSLQKFPSSLVLLSAIIIHSVLKEYFTLHACTSTLNISFYHA